VQFAGDWRRNAAARLVRLMVKRHGAWPQDNKPAYFDWEPFEVVRDILREERGKRDSSVGGPPQLLKIYEHLNCHNLGVFWPDRSSGVVCIAGRALLGYETPEAWVLDPDTLTTSHAFYSKPWLHPQDELSLARSRLLSLLAFRGGEYM
jgi:hypothetical protein